VASPLLSSMGSLSSTLVSVGNRRPPAPPASPLQPLAAQERSPGLSREDDRQKDVRGAQSAAWWELRSFVSKERKES